MKILLCVTTLYRGGAERVVTNLANAFIERGHTVEILLYKKSEIGYPLDKSVTLTIDKTVSKNPIAHIIWRRKYIKNREPEIVISFLDQLNMINILALLGSRTPLIVANRDDPHFSPHNPFLRLVRNFLFHFTDRIIVQNQHNLEYFSTNLQKKAAIIYNAVDLKGMEGNAIHSEKVNHIAWVGRLTKQKNPQMMLEAFYEFSKSYPDYILDIYGDGILREELLKDIHNHNFEQKIILHGSVDNIYEQISNAKMFVLTSQFEGMPNALIEAMCLGLPVISTKVAGATDVIKNGENGFLINLNDVNSLINAMARITKDEKIQSQVAHNASDLYKRLNSQVILKKWEAEIRLTCDSKRS